MKMRIVAFVCVLFLSQEGATSAQEHQIKARNNSGDYFFELFGAEHGRTIEAEIAAQSEPNRYILLRIIMTLVTKKPLELNLDPNDHAALTHAVESTMMLLNRVPTLKRVLETILRERLARYDFAKQLRMLNKIPINENTVQTFAQSIPFDAIGSTLKLLEDINITMGQQKARYNQIKHLEAALEELEKVHVPYALRDAIQQKRAAVNAGLKEQEAKKAKAKKSAQNRDL